MEEDTREAFPQETASESMQDHSEEQHSEEQHSEPRYISSFDELKDQLSKNLENLRFLWGENKDVLFLFNQVIS